MIRKIIFLAVMSFFCVQILALAAVSFGERTGTLVITSPDGTVLTVGPNEPLPVIPDGSAIQVVDGVAQISTTGATTVSVMAGGQTFQCAVGTTVNFMFEPTGAVLMEVTAGQVTTTVADGRTATIDPGNQIRLTSAGSVDVITGEVVLTDSEGETSTLGVGSSIEGYTPPEIPDVTGVDENVQSEETSRDISPVKS